MQQMAGQSGFDPTDLGNGDPLLSCRELQNLISLQNRASRNYFRLLEANRELGARTSNAPKSIGTILAESMEMERQRLGRELHTGAGQALAGIHLHVELIHAAMPDPPERVGSSLRQISNLAASAMEQVRGVSRKLYIPAWQAQTLPNALRELWDASGISEKFDANLNLQELSEEPGPGVRRAIYLAAQEAISNAIQHARARRVWMNLRQDQDRIVLQFGDDGSGFAARADDEKRPPAGIGLRSMRDLARDLGGEFEAESTPEGALLTISIPVNHE